MAVNPAGHSSADNTWSRARTIAGRPLNNQ